MKNSFIESYVVDVLVRVSSISRPIDFDDDDDDDDEDDAADGVERHLPRQ